MTRIVNIGMNIDNHLHFKFTLNSVFADCFSSGCETIQLLCNKAVMNIHDSLNLK